MRMWHYACRISLGLLLLGLPATAQEPAAPVQADPGALPAGEVYLFAHAAPATADEAARALEVFEASPARILILTPLPGAALAAEFGTLASKPVLLAGRPCTQQEGGCVVAHTEGPDSFLALAEDRGGGIDGDAYLTRRGARASRWSIAAMRHYEPLEQPRLDLVLLRDDPVDVLLVGTSSLLSSGPDAKSPFGSTLVFGPQAPEAGSVRLFEVSDSGVSPYVPKEPAPEDAPADATAKDPSTP